MDLGQIYFDSPFAFGGCSSVTTGKVPLVGEDLSDESFVQQWSEAKELFERGILAYQLIQSIQGKFISQFQVVDFGRALFHISHFKTGLSESIFLDHQSFINAQAEELDQVKLYTLPK
jgi:hypothetical protein